MPGNTTPLPLTCLHRSIGLAALVLADLLAPRPAFCADNDVSMVEVMGEGAKYWSRWRGPSGQGLAEGKYTDVWSAPCH